MKESEERSSNIDEQKARIRQRYKGIDPEELEVIPALPPEDIFKTEKKLRVAVYARVSTDDPRQTSSYELQKNHYQDVVNKNPNWMLVEIYADEGICWHFDSTSNSDFYLLHPDNDFSVIHMRMFGVDHP